MNMFARFDENPAMTLEDIKETKRYGRTDGRTDARRGYNEEDSIKNKGARVVTALFIDFSDAQGQLTLKSVIESC